MFACWSDIANPTQSWVPSLNIIIITFSDLIICFMDPNSVTLSYHSINAIVKTWPLNALSTLLLLIIFSLLLSLHRFHYRSGCEKLCDIQLKMMVSLLLLLFLKQAMVSTFRKFLFNFTVVVRKFERNQKETGYCVPRILSAGYAPLKALKMTISRLLGRATFKTKLQTTLDVGDVKIMTIYFSSS